VSAASDPSRTLAEKQVYQDFFPVP